MHTSISLEPIGYVEGGRVEIQDDAWGDVRAAIKLDPARFGVDALKGLEDFSHVVVIFFFHRAPTHAIAFGARRPRGRADWPVTGIFAQRGKDRPNRLGLCTCKVVRVEGLTLEVEGLDAVHGTPVVDIKPVLRGFLPRGPIREPPWASVIMADYWERADLAEPPAPISTPPKPLG